jgi:hypothetical protein
MGRPRIGKTAMTPAERQRRRRAKLAEIIDPERVIADLDRIYQRAVLVDQDTMRAGVKKLLRRWDRQHETNKRIWRRISKRRSRAA